VIELFGWMKISEYDQLKQRCEALKATCLDWERVNRRLQDNVATWMAECFKQQNKKIAARALLHDVRDSLGNIAHSGTCRGEYVCNNCEVVKPLKATLDKFLETGVHD
jgi:hypothetical protein